MIKCLILLFTLILYGQETLACTINPDKNYFKYLKNLKVGRISGQRILKIDNKTYQLGGKKIKDCDLVFLNIPLENVLISSTTFWAFIKAIKATSNISGIIDSKYIFNQNDIKNITNFKTPLRLEFVLKHKVKNILSYQSGSKDLIGEGRISKFNIVNIEINEHKEDNPLKRLEWVKVFGLLFNKESESIDHFNKVESDYLKHISKKKNLKKVLVGSFYNGSWFSPGINSYFANIIKDAGGKYLLQEKVLNIEKIIIKAKDAEIWFPHNNWIKLFRSDPQYRSLEGIFKIDVYNFTNKVNESGGIDIWENGILYPNLILKEIQSIIKGNHSPIWYKKLH